MSHHKQIFDKVAAQSFQLLPTNWISRTWGRFARTSTSRYLVRPFSKIFRVQTGEAENPPSTYPTFNAFFTRRLRPEVRPIDRSQDAIISPVDGLVSAAGICDGDQLLQVKGSRYSLFGLLRDGAAAKIFTNGFYSTLYLSPRDYHRVHAPLDLSISGLGYMPGILLPVNGPSVRWVQRLYTQNERLVLYCDTAIGQVAIVLVGAHCVGSISLAFSDFLTNRPGLGPMRLRFKKSVRIEKGSEVGAFEMGSTVILIFEPHRIIPDLPTTGSPVRMGQRIGSFLSVQ